MISKEVHFTSKDVMLVCCCSKPTIRRREEKKIYPQPRKDVANRRWYTLDDLITLQILTFKEIRPHLLLEALFHKDIKNAAEAKKMLEEAINKRIVAKPVNPLPER